MESPWISSRQRREHGASLRLSASRGVRHFSSWNFSRSVLVIPVGIGDHLIALYSYYLSPSNHWKFLEISH